MISSLRCRHNGKPWKNGILKRCYKFSECKLVIDEKHKEFLHYCTY